MSGFLDSLRTQIICSFKPFEDEENIISFVAQVLFLYENHETTTNKLNKKIKSSQQRKRNYIKSLTRKNNAVNKAQQKRFIVKENFLLTDVATRSFKVQRFQNTRDTLQTH